jgi:hypothetical protein
LEIDILPGWAVAEWVVDRAIATQRTISHELIHVIQGSEVLETLLSLPLSL